MTQQHRTWSGIAKLAVEKLVTRPFANRMAGLVAIAGVIVVVGPPVALLVASKAAAHFWQFDIPVSPPGPLDYAAGLSLVFGALIYSGWIHYVTTLASIKQRQNDVSLEIELLDRQGKPLTNGFHGNLYTVQDQKKIPSLSKTGHISLLLNHDYYRDWFHFVHIAGNGIHLRFKVRNVGFMSARKLVVKVGFDADVAFELLSQRQLPRVPTKETDYGANLRGVAIKPDTTVRGSMAEFAVEILNPGDEFVTSHIVAVRPQGSGTITLTSRMFAEDLPSPITSTFEIDAEIEATELSIEDIVRGRVP